MGELMYSCQNKSCKAYNLEIPSALVLEGNFECYLCRTPLLPASSSEKDLTERINRDYPSLLARPYSAMISRTDPEAALKRLLDVFTGLLKLLSTLMESEYLHSKKLDSELTEIILKDLKTPTLGKWMYFLYNALNLNKLEEVVFKEYKDYFLKNYIDLSEILSYRNEFYHSFQGSEEKLHEDYRKYKVLLDNLLSALPLSGGLFVKGKKRGVFEMKGLHPIEVQNCPLKFEDSEALFWDGKNRILSVFPLHATEEGEESNSFMYVASTDKRIIYEGLHGETLDTVRTQNRYKELLKRKTPERKVLRDDKDKELVSRMQEETRKTLIELQEMRKFIPDKYVHRIYPEREMNRFLDSHSTGLMVLAKSGGGKSSLLAFYSEKLLSENVPILFLQGKSLNDEYIESQIRGNLSIDYDFSIALKSYDYLPQKSFRGILIIDGVNEAQNPERVLQGLLMYAKELKDSDCKILISLRSDFWSGIDSKNKESYPLDFFFTPPGENFEPEKERGLILNSLTGGEKNTLYERLGGLKENLNFIEKENRPLWDYFQSPLHLSFYCAIEKNFPTPEILSPDSVQREYFQKVVVQNKQHIADCLRALGFFLLEKDVSKISLEEAWEMETTKRYLKDRKPDSPFTLLTKSDVLREFRSGGETFIVFSYDIYLEESVGLALFSKPYRGSGRQLAKLNPKTGVLQSSIASSLARSMVKSEFDEIPGYLDSCYTFNERREDIQRALIRKVGEVSPDLLNNLSQLILKRNKDEDWNFLFEVSLELENKLRYQDSVNLLSNIIKSNILKNLDKNLSDVYIYYGYILDIVGDYKKSIELINSSLNIRLNLYRNDHQDISECYTNLGYVYFSLGEFDKSLEYHELALKLNISLFGDSHSKVASCLNEIGSVYYSKGEYGSAKEYYENALKIRITNLGKKHSDVAGSYNNLALIYEAMNEFEEALKYYKYDFNIIYDLYGENHPDIASNLSNMGIVYNSLEDYDKAIELLERSLEIRKKIFGDTHPEVSMSLNNLGEVYKNMGDYVKSLEYFYKSRDLRVNIFGEIHYELADTYNNIGLVYDLLRDFEKAWDYYLKSINILLRVFGEDHPNIEKCKVNICNNLESIDSLNFHKKAHSELLSIFPNTSLFIANIYKIYGDVAFEINPQESQKYYENALDIMNLNGEQQSIEYAELNISYGNLLNSIESISYYKIGLEIYQTLFGEDSINLAYLYKKIGFIFFNDSEFEDALENFEKSLSIFESSLENHKEDIINLLIVLSSNYQLLGDYDRAEVYRKQSQELGDGN